MFLKFLVKFAFYCSIIRFHHLLIFLQFSSLIISTALSNFHLVFFKFVENFLTIFLKLNVFLLCIPAGICGHSQIPARMPVDRGTCENAKFGEGASVYSHIYCCKLQTPIRHVSVPAIERASLVKT